MAQRMGTGMALLFHDCGTRRGLSGQQHAPAALNPRKRHGTHFTGGWVDTRAGLDVWKISSTPGFDPGPTKVPNSFIFNVRQTRRIQNFNLECRFYSLLKRP